MTTQVQVIKRDGRKEPLDVEKIHKVVEWACEGLTGVSVSEIELASQIQFYNNIKSSDIHETMIKSAAELITAETPNYQYVAGRLISYHLRKEVYGKYEPDHLKDHWDKISAIGFYDSALGDLYTDDEWNELNSYIKHNRDDMLVYVAMEQLRGKYLVKNRSTKQIYETPQISFMLIAMTLFSKYKKDRIRWVKNLYDAISTYDISLPTPIMAGVRTPQKQFSSCVLVESDDNLDSINATASAIVKYVSQKAGIGIGAGRIRAFNSPIRNGDATHTGTIPFYRYFQTATASCSQGGIRGGQATLFYPIWHLDVEDLLVLKNSKGTEETRIRQMDYGVQFNKVMYERLINNGNITLFCPNDVPDLYDAFFADQDLFKELYEKYERSTKIRKKTVSALELFTNFMQERKDTGRIYLMNVDHCNTHGSFKEELAPIKQSNLCVEITLPTKPLTNIEDEDGLIALCTLGAINWGKIKKPSDFMMPCSLLVRALDALLDYQNYPVKAAERHTKAYRPLGIGVINLAYWLAKNNMTYTDPDLKTLHEYVESWSYYLLRASVEIAKEQGPCERSSDTKYHEGILPIDTYKESVDELVNPVYTMPWNTLREDLRKYGCRNSTLMALMPSESSSQVSNATNGIEPPRSLVSVKQSKDGVFKQVVPEIFHLKNKYELLWDQQSPEGYLKIAAIFQKFVDQSISTNTSYNPKFYPDEKIPMSEMLKHLLMMYKYGLKTGYYFNTADGAGEIEDEDCDSCKI